ncbi:MoaD/ThiS family protein [Nocardioides sp. Bht2]|uniref:MoaD/ThiS family protein n=1 Tax=Nocardioides sp. Bht2 TaxID=3392297 RepID=UPI0039B523DB
MEPLTTSTPDSGTSITVRYWAAARAATGRHDDDFPAIEPLTLAELRSLVVARHPDADAVLGLCSVLVNDRPVNGDAALEHQVRAGDSVEFLPPFAGG